MATTGCSSCPTLDRGETVSVILRPCAAPGCSELVLRGRCSRHARPSRWIGRQARGGTRTQRGYGTAWSRLRAQVGEEEQQCRACGSTDARWICDHIVPKAMGGTDERGNLQRLCRACSDRKTGGEGGRKRAGSC